MPRSSLANYVCISPNRYAGRAYPITKITVHHMAGNLTVEQCGAVFASSARQASSNYGVGTDGRIGCYVDEADAAWTSANWDNDNRAVTIEVANDNLSTWSSSDAAYDATVALCADICRRNGIPKLNYTGDASGSLTEHRMFSATACPGPWWHARMAQFAADVNAALAQQKKAKVNDLKTVNAKGGKFYRLASTKPQKMAAVHRFARTQASIDELKGKGYALEGHAFTIKAGGTVPVYKLRNAKNGDDLYTKNYQEAVACQNDGWVYQGVPFVAPAKGKPMHRLYNPSNQEHLFTTSETERKALEKAGFRYEFVAFYVDAVSSFN